VRYRRPFSRFFVPDLVEVLRDEGIIETISASTVWRILDDDALKPWRHRSWIYPRDEAFYERAAAVLDLYAGKWRGRALRRDEFVISADEKTSIQARRRLHPPTMRDDGRGQRVEHEYERCGAWAYLAAWDVRRAKLFDRVEETTGIEPFGRLVDQVMRREPYRSARRVFWVVDGGSSHHRSTFPDRLKGAYRHAVAVFTPVHASWLTRPSARIRRRIPATRRALQLELHPPEAALLVEQHREATARDQNTRHPEACCMTLQRLMKFGT
jgi:hypothetical protein